MTRLIGLYPRRWRERYEEEIVALLAARPPGVRDRIDLVRGALDARVHQEIPGEVEAHCPIEPHRVAGALAIVGGTGVAIRSMLFGTMQHAGSTVEEGTWLAALLAGFIGVLAFATAMALIVVRDLDDLGPIAGLGGSIGVFGFTLTAIGSGLVLPVGVGGMALLAWRMAGRRISRTLAVAWVATGVLAAVATLLLMSRVSTNPAGMLLVLPFCVAWLVVGRDLVLGWAPARPAERES